MAPSLHESNGTGELQPHPVTVFAPDAEGVQLVIDGGEAVDMRRTGDHWVAHVPIGARYALRVLPRSGDGDRLLVDPRAALLEFPSGHSRTAARPGGAGGSVPWAVAAPWPQPRPQRHTSRPLVVYEAHVRGLTKLRPRADAGTFRAAIDEVPRLRDLWVSVLEFLPVHQYDPDEGNYWGYMPLVFGAVHRQYAAGDHPAEELADLVAAAHELDIEVWLDVVVNHTTESDRSGPTYNLRALADREYYVVRPDGSYVDDAGTGNIIDASSPPAQRLVMESLDRLADLGVDGFRFDLAAVLARDPAFVCSIGDWAQQRGVRLVAEPWDLARYLLGPDFPDHRWMQWNGQFRDDMRGFLRGEPGMVERAMRRVSGSADLFDDPMKSVNFLTAHDGFTMYDLVSYDHQHNEVNGWNNTDGHHDNRSWNWGWEGDEGVTGEVIALRRRQMRNAMCLLMLSHGVPMFVAGDEFARTQRGNNNPYNQDNEISWVDWTRSEEYVDHERFVRFLIELRASQPLLVAQERWDGRVDWHGIGNGPDTSFESRSVAWHLDGLYVMANMFWEPLEFTVQVPGDWYTVVDTASPTGLVESAPAGDAVRVEGRSIVILTTRRS
jgi:isoamylase